LGTAPLFSGVPDQSDPHELLGTDDHLGPLIERHGHLEFDPAEDLYERLVVSILRQQVSMASAAATRERLFEAVAVTPEGVLAADPGTLRDAGLSRQKTEYVRNVAETFREEGYDRAYFLDRSNEEIRSALTAIKGVGEWTVDMQLLFTFGRPDVFPVGDLGVREGMATLFEMDREAREEMVELAKRWRPYRSYASLYLWRVSEDLADGVEEVVEKS
jgi:DNA-3-methyladenine glycosylase II